MGLTKRQHTIKVNYLSRVKAVQEAYRNHKVDGQPDTYVWRMHIWPKFFISLPTFYRYLQTVPDKELKNIGAQGSLF
jgi:hypothetical protein